MECIAIVLTLAMDQWTMLMRTPRPVIPWRRTIYWNPPGWVSYFVPLDGEELLNLQWNLVILMQSRPLETTCMWTKTHHWKKGKGKGTGPAYSSLCYFLRPGSITSPGQHVWSTQPGQIRNAMARLMSKEQVISVILTEGANLPIQVPAKYVFPNLDFCYSCCIQLEGKPLVPSCRLNVVCLYQMDLLIFHPS